MKNVERSERKNIPGSQRFIGIAQGLVAKLITGIYLSREVGFLNPKRFNCCMVH
jgi:hypothetical protein